jgi:hypothetical protein
MKSFVSIWQIGVRENVLVIGGILSVFAVEIAGLQCEKIMLCRMGWVFRVI